MLQYLLVKINIFDVAGFVHLKKISFYIALSSSLQLVDLYYALEETIYIFQDRTFIHNLIKCLRCTVMTSNSSFKIPAEEAARNKGNF